MFDNFQDYTIAELKQMISNYRQYHNINVTKKKKADLVNLLNEKFVLRNNVLYMKLEDGDEFLDRTEDYLRSQNLPEFIPERRRKLPTARQPAPRPQRGRPPALKPAPKPKSARKSRKHRWDSQVQLEKQRQRNGRDNILDEEPIEQPRKLKKLRKNQKSNLDNA